MNESNPVGDLVVLSEQLADLITEENEMLRDMRPHEIAALQERKVALSQAYEDRMHRVAAAPEQVKALEPDSKAILRRIAERLNQVAAENRMRLQAARDANEKLIRAIVGAVRESQEQLDVYTAAGSTSRAAYPTSRAANPVSISINQRL